MTVFVRFFQRQGLAPAAAVAAGAIDSLAGNAIQAVLVLSLLLFSSEDVGLDLETPGSGSLRLLWIVVGLLALTVLVVAAVGRIRRALVSRVRVWWPQVKALVPDAALAQQAAAPDRREPRDRGAVRRRARPDGVRVRLPDPAADADPDQLGHVALRELHPGPRRDRRRRVRARGRAHLGRDDAVGRARDDRPLPALDLLPAADLGVLRASAGCSGTATSEARAPTGTGRGRGRARGTAPRAGRGRCCRPRRAAARTCRGRPSPARR